MRLSETILFDAAPCYTLSLSGFNLDRITEFDDYFQQTCESLFYYVCSLPQIAEPVSTYFYDTLLPPTIITGLKKRISIQYVDMSQEARITFWSILSVILCNLSHKYRVDIIHEKRFKDPKLGPLFKAIHEQFTQRRF